MHLSTKHFKLIAITLSGALTEALAIEQNKEKRATIRYYHGRVVKRFGQALRQTNARFDERRFAADATKENP